MADKDNNTKDEKYSRLTPVLEYSYVVLYNMLNTVRSMKNYVDMYTKDEGLDDMEQYHKAAQALDEAMQGLTEAAKKIGQIYGLPEDFLNPEKMAAQLADQLKAMQGSANMPSAPAAGMPGTPPAPAPHEQPAQAPAPAPAPAPHAGPVGPEPKPPAPEPKPAPEPAPAPHEPAPAPSAPAPAPAAPAAPTPPAPQTSAPADSQTTSASSAGKTSDDDEEINKILEQLKALRQNQG